MAYRLLFYDWLIQRRMPFKYIQSFLEYMIWLLPAKSFLHSFLKTQLEKYVLWVKTMNFRVILNLHKNKDYKIFEIDDFLSHEQCNAIMDLAVEKGIPESTIVNDHGMHVLDLFTRNSKPVWLAPVDHPAVAYISDHVSKMTELPVAHQEHLQVVVYYPRGYHQDHFDTPFHPDGILNMNKGCGPRLYTILMYLNDNYDGGETYFEEVGIRVKPKKGKAIFFQNIDDRLDLIPESVHAGLPVTRGTKWVANMWVRIWPMDLQELMREEEFKNALLPKKSSLSCYIADWAQWLWYVFANKRTHILPKMDILNWTIWHNCMIYNSLCIPWRHQSNRYAVIEIEDFLHQEDCNKMIATGYDSVIDKIITNNLLQAIHLPVNDENNYVSRLHITCCTFQNADPDLGHVLSPYSNPSCSLTSDHNLPFGLSMASLYIFLNGEPTYFGGAFDFPYIRKFITPKQGNAIICLHLNEAMAFDCKTMCYRHPVTVGQQWIAEKHIGVLPNQFVSILQKAESWVEDVDQMLKKRV